LKNLRGNRFQSLREVLVKSGTGRIIGAAVGAVIFVWFFATIADRLVNPVSAAEPTATVTTVP
jgi:hypothetical protein